MKREAYDAMRNAFLDAYKDARDLRLILSGTTHGDHVMVPRALLESVAVAHALMAGWCVSTLDDEARNE